MERRKVTRRTEHTQAVKGLGQECKVQFWLVSYVSCISFPDCKTWRSSLL